MAAPAAQITVHEFAKLTDRDFMHAQVITFRQNNLVPDFLLLAAFLVLRRAHLKCSRGNGHHPHTEAVGDFLILSHSRLQRAQERNTRYNDQMS